MRLLRRFSGGPGLSGLLLLLFLVQQELLEEGLHRLDVLCDLREAVLDAFVDVLLGDFLLAGELQVQKVDRDFDPELAERLVVAVARQADFSPGVQVAFALHSHLEPLR